MTERARPAGGLGAIGGTLRAVARTSPWRAAQALWRLNQEGGFNCPGCAWPEEAGRTHIDWCENGVKHVAHEVTRRRVGAEFFAEWPIDKLLGQSDQWLESQGRLVEPVLRRRGSDRYEPIAWEAAFALIAEALRSLAVARRGGLLHVRARRATRPRFSISCFVRQFGTNNLPDCSNMCHESSGTGAHARRSASARARSSLDDFDKADAIFIIGQNPGTNHPRMLTTLQAAKRRGCKIVSINPLPERALVRFAHPQELLGLLGSGTALADLYLQVRINGDVALLKGIMKEVLAAEARAPGRVLDRAFIAQPHRGLRALPSPRSTRSSWDDFVARERHLARADRARRPRSTLDAERDDRLLGDGPHAAQERRRQRAGDRQPAAPARQHRQAGRGRLPGARPQQRAGRSHDGHLGAADARVPRPRSARSSASSRRGARLRHRRTRSARCTTGRSRSSSRWAATSCSASARHGVHGGGAAPLPPDGRRSSTKLNRTHLITGDRALILLPCLGRTEARRAGKRCAVRDGRGFDERRCIARSGKLKPASSELRSEPAIVARSGARDCSASAGRVDVGRAGRELRSHPRRDRARRAGVRGLQPPRARTGRLLPAERARRRGDSPRHREGGIHRAPRCRVIELGDGEFLMMTIRSHDQFNTTIYGLDDRYRGITGDRRVVLLHPDDIAAEGLSVGERVDLQSHFAEESRRVEGFEVVAYDVPPRCAATYYPEGNPLVPLGSVADGSNTPTYKSVRIVIKRRS